MSELERSENPRKPIIATRLNAKARQFTPGGHFLEPLWYFDSAILLRFFRQALFDRVRPQPAGVL